MKRDYKRSISITISEKLLYILQDMTIEQNRPMANLIETIVKNDAIIKRQLEKASSGGK